MFEVQYVTVERDYKNVRAAFATGFGYMWALTRNPIERIEKSVALANGFLEKGYDADTAWASAWELTTTLDEHEMRWLEFMECN
jgi:hypothetical protein